MSTPRVRANVPKKMKSAETKAADTVTGMVGVSSMSPASTVSAADFSAALQVTVCPRSCDGVSCACPRTMNGFHRTICHSTRVLAFARVVLDNIKTRLAHMDE